MAQEITDLEVDNFLKSITVDELRGVVREWLIIKRSTPEIIMPEALYLLESGTLRIYRENPIMNITIGGILEYDVIFQQEIIIKGFYKQDPGAGVRILYFLAGAVTGGLLVWVMK